MADATLIPESTGAEVANQTDQTLEAGKSQQGLAPEKTQEQAPQYVTKDDLAQFGETLAKRIKQSASDKSKRIEAEVDSLKQRLNTAGVQLQPQQETALRTQIADQLESEEDLIPQSTEQVDGRNQVDQFVTDALEPFGVKIDPNSPHFKDLQKVVTETWNDPDGGKKVLKATIEYGKKESERLASNQENATARVVGSGGEYSNGNTDASASDLWKQAYKK